MSEFIISPLTPERWDDLEALFGLRGASGGCWCMYWRLPRKIFDTQIGEENRLAFKDVVQQGPPPGLLAYDGTKPIGWVALAPRSAYPALERSRTLKSVDEKPVWSIVCFFIHKQYRRKGVMKSLILGAIEYAKAQGASILEAYPVDTHGKTYPDAFAYTGLFSTFLHLGFQEIERRAETRPILRYTLESGQR